MRDVGIADRIRLKAAAWGAPIDVVEVDGWHTRGSEFTRRPTLAVGHHTGNPNTGWAPSLGICTNGRGGPNPVPGPLCNGLRARKRAGRYTVFVIAAGVANHAGKGGYAGLTGNHSAYGLEVENNGTTEAWSAEDQEIDALILAAMLEGSGHTGLEHKEWAPGRKPDRHHIDGNVTRALVAKYLNDQGDPDMAFEQGDKEKLNQIYDWAMANQKLNEHQFLEKILQRLDAHIANPNTGGGAGGISRTELEAELREEITAA
ncbi:MAG: N-acetylmuramoyl-L-alanine amidase, partial [Acidimicrobiales bacterium]|nr:N-acetylmuramoyl-L-alanine amidase [Acidimicrobiales bacterium]